ncbi:cupin domain-containing protein [Croceiramulus getboli]|nr:cupin domain-containing protein [Flavobacteriaceae bacterium YJPT1-3]
MIRSLLILLLCIPFTLLAQTEDYQVASYHTLGNRAPNAHYLGDAWLNGLLNDDLEADYHLTKATFKANSTLDWHKHQSPQVLIVVEGEGYYQERGKQPIRMRVGDVISCKPNTEHWHASSKTSSVTYLALYSGDQPTTWTEVLTQEDYDRVAALLN